MDAVREVATGVWHWEAPHPDWKPEEDWDEAVSSYAVDDGSRLLLFDPLAPPAEIEQLAAGRAAAIVLTCPWHRRDGEELAKRLGAPLFVPPPDASDEPAVEGHVFRAGDTLPGGMEAFPGMEESDVVLWVESRGAVVAGDSLIVRNGSLEIPADWVGDALEGIRDGLRPLLDRRVEHVLATHGGPSDPAALERALS
jgi:glyoxylase-like metal-dependent hydrolase (beta-lactamase superfamily II)